MLAEQRGLTATFMPKPFADRTGNGLHLHLSLWKEQTPLFVAGAATAAADPYGLGLSQDAYHFIGGLLTHAPALHAVIAPTVNSYKRTGAVSTASGTTWAPRAATWGGNDRTHLVRVPDRDRIELRGTDGSADPYLASAAVLVAGHDGIQHHLDPGTPGIQQTAQALPRTLLDAVRSFEADQVIRSALDETDPTAGVSAHYAKLKREEFHTWHNTISAWEIEHYLNTA